MALASDKPSDDFSDYLADITEYDPAENQDLNSGAVNSGAVNSGAVNSGDMNSGDVDTGSVDFADSVDNRGEAASSSAGTNAVDSNTLLGRLPYKLSTEAFYSTTTEQERDLLRFEVNCALQHFIEFDRPIFLEGLGLFIPSKTERDRAYPSGQSLIVRKESVRSVIFEKCDDISGAQSIYAAQGKKVVETHELASRIYPRLPMGLHLKWTDQAMRSLLRAYLFSVRERLVTKGVSQFLSTVGTLYALHNRQGSTPNDWYAGSDILLLPRRAQVLQVTESKLCARPVFLNSWEPLEALYGKAVSTLCLDLVEVLKKTGFAVDDASDESAELNLKKSQVEVAIFLDKDSKPSQPRLIWCTKGIRELAIKSSAEVIGTELIVQTPAKLGDSSGSVDRHFVLASRLLALGWAVLHGTRNKTLRPGLGMNTEAPIISNPKSLLTAIVATHAHPLYGVHLDADGEFSYANITGISHREAKLISAGKRIHLLAMLELRTMDQITQPRRVCLMEHTTLE